MKQLNDLISDMVDAGEPDEVISEVIKSHKAKYGITKPAVERDPSTYSEMERAAADAYTGGTFTDAVKPVTDLYDEGYFTSEEFIRPMLEGGLAAGGGLIGSGLGPLGTAGGGIQGFAIGDQITDMIYHPDKFDDPAKLISDMLKKYEKGAEAEALGLGLGTAGKGVLGLGKAGAKGLGAIKDSLLGKTTEPFKTKAGNYLAEYLSRDFNDTAIADEIEAFNGLKKIVPEIEPRLGQSTNNPDLLAFTEQVRGSNPKLYEDLLQQQNVNNRKALTRYLGKFFPKDGPGVTATMDSLKSVRSALEAGESAAKEDLQILAEAASGIKGADEIVEAIRNVSSAARGVAKTRLDKAWAELPDIEMEGSDVLSWLDNFPKMWRDERGTELTSGFNTYLNNLKNDFSKSGYDSFMRPSRKIMLQKLREKAQVAGQEAWELGGSEARPFYRVKEKLESLIDTVKGEDYAAVKKMHSDFKDTFDKGAVGDLLNIRKDYSNDKLANKFFSSRDVKNIQQLRRAVGDTQARELMRAEALVNLKNSSAYDKATKEINPVELKKWLETNKRVLDESGLSAEFGDKKQLSDNLIQASKSNKAFQNRSFSKALNANPQEFFDELYGGKKNTAEITKDTLKALAKLKGNPDALKGMQNGFKDYMWGQVEKEISGEKVLDSAKFNELMHKFEPVNKLLYSGDPSKLDAMRNARKILDTLSRQSSRISGDVIPKDTLMQTLKSFLPFIFPKYSMVSGVRGMMDTGLGLSRQKIEDMLVRAAFDEQYANQLFNARTKEEVKVLIDMIKERGKTQAITAGILSPVINNPEVEKFTNRQ